MSSTAINRKLILFAIVTLGLLNSFLSPLSFGPFTPAKVHADQFITGPAIEGSVFAVTASNKLILFNQSAPSAIINSVNIGGLQANEQILGLDFRPRTAQLFAFSNQGRVYTIATATGAATQVGSAPLSPVPAGNAFGFDFNPVPDRIRVVSDAEVNLRLVPDTGAIGGTDTGLAFAPTDLNVTMNPNIVGAAYTNNFGGATSTTLYVIDSNLDILALQGSVGGSPVSPNTGQLTTVGPLGFNTTDQVGFDISGSNGIAYASLTGQSATTSTFYTINLATGAATSVGTIGGGEIIRDIAVVVRLETMFALTADNNLLMFNSGTPGTIAATRPITGLPQGENLVGMDFRPANGQLYAMSSGSRVYTINTATGAAAPVVGIQFNPLLSGASFGFDFNPVPDRIRVVSDTRQNLRLNQNTGGVAATDTQLAFASGDPNANTTPSIVGSAYTNNFAGTTTTTLYGIDFNLDALVLQGSVGGTPNSPNGGQLTTVGALGVNTTDQVGFDISPSGAAFASLTAPSATTSSLYTINLATGAATLIGAIGSTAIIRDIAIAPRVEIVYGVTPSKKLVSFAATAPGVILSTAAISNLAANETIVGLDFRPANRLLYALSSASRIYILDPLTGAATPVGGVTNPQVTGSVGFDFNPVPDRIRVISGGGQNLRFNPDTGATAATDGALAFAAGDPNAGKTPNAVSAAYNNNFAGTTSTTLFVIDSTLDALVTQGSPGGAPVSPNTGQLFTVGALGVDTSDQVGFDIADQTNKAYASLTVGGATQLYSINLTTGAATSIATIGGGEPVTGITVANTPPTSTTTTAAVAVNAASFVGTNIAPNSLVALFGNFQTMGGAFFSATTQPMPTTLGGMKVTINGVDAQLLFVNNGQVNLMTPDLSNDGPTSLVVTNADGSARSGVINVVRAAAGIFSFRSSGAGTAAAMVTSDGVNFQPVFNPDGTEREFSPGTTANPVFLVLFTTGVRNVPAANPTDANGVAESVMATIKGTQANVIWAGPAPGFSGLDQVNITVPPSLSGAGISDVKLTVGGQMTNSVTIRIGQ